MEIAAQGLDPAVAYRLLIGIVVPRPIAWVTSLNAKGQVNAAPFSAYTFCGKNPPMICFNVGRRPDGGYKDTAANVRKAGEFVVNVVTHDIIDPMHETSAEYPADVSEVEALGLEMLPSSLVKPPRIAISPIHLECKTHQIIELGRDNDELVIGEVVNFHIRDELLINGRIPTKSLNPLARLGGPNYAKLGEHITMAFTSEFGVKAEKRDGTH